MMELKRILGIIWLMHVAALVAGTSHITRGFDFNSLEAKPFRITQQTIQQFWGHASETFRSRSFLQCTSYCLKKINYVGNAYDDEQEMCYLLDATTGIRELADDAGSVKVILYEPGEQDCNDVGVSYRDCLSWYENGFQVDGIYCINPDAAGAFPAFCDMSRDGGGWTVFQRRIDASVKFYRKWDHYVNGFGDLSGNVWIGLEKLHAMTVAATNLHIYLETFSGESAVAMYRDFSVGNVSSGYLLTIGTYSGTAGNSLKNHDGMKFSTYDNDQDLEDAKSCAVQYKAGWWFRDCYSANLNGPYLSEFYQIETNSEGIVWVHFKGFEIFYKTAIMKLRRLN